MQVEVVTNLVTGAVLSGSREEMTHLCCGLLSFVKDRFSVTGTFTALASQACTFFQLTHASCTLLSSSNDVAVSYSFADTYVHLSLPEMLLRTDVSINKNYYQTQVF